MFSRRIFIGTTLQGAPNLRRAAIDAVWRCNMSPVLEDEDLASPLSLVERMRQAIDEADAFIGVLDPRYGMSYSFADVEYRRALERGIPLLTFLSTDVSLDGSPWNATTISSRFIDDLKAHSLIEYFTDSLDLGRKIFHGLVHLARRWGDSVVSDAEVAAAERLETATDKIFLSYRRQDTVATCLHLDYRLEEHFGEQAIYMDQSSIPGGADWQEHIKVAVARSGVVLALIGTRWLTIKGEQELRKIDDPDDTLRQEITIALERRIPVIPVLVDAAKMPKRENLPESLWSLRKHQALRLRNTRADFSSDVQRIIGAAESWINTVAEAD